MDNTLEIEWVATERLFPNPANPRLNEAAVPHVVASIRRFGWQQPIVAKPSGEVIAGHTRLLAAREMEEAQVPVTWFTGSDLDAAGYLIADNRSHTFSDWDDEALAKLLGELRAEDALEGVGFSGAEIDELLAEIESEAGDGGAEDPGPGDVPEAPASQQGDLWLLGPHRLLCGDSTSQAALERLMADETAALLATDPPYLVDYKGRSQAAREEAEGAGPHWDDYTDRTSALAFFSHFLDVCLRHCREDVPIYQWHATKRQMLVEEAWQANGLLLHQTIIWAKPRGVLTRSHFLWSHEPCFYGWREGKMPRKPRVPEASARTVWEVEGEKDGIHPTQKPCELFRRPIQWHTLKGEVCLEPFSGSGTQLIAAEQLGRRCFAMEQDPGYVDVAVKRWQQATGRQATLEGTGETFAELQEDRGAP